MRTQAQINSDLEELVAAQSAVVNTIAIKKTELMNIQSSHGELVVKNIGKKQPASLRSQRGMIADLVASIKEMEELKPTLEAKRQALETEEELIRVYQKVNEYNRISEAYFSSVSNVLQVIDELSEVLQKLDGAVTGLKKSQSPNFILEAILRELSQRGLSPSSFFDKGTIEQVDMEKDNLWLTDLARKYRQPLNRWRELRMPSLNDLAQTAMSYLVMNSGDGLKREFMVKPPQATSGSFITKDTIEQHTSTTTYSNKQAMYIAQERERLAKRQKQNRGLFESK